MPVRCLTIAFLALSIMESQTHAAPSPREAEVITDSADIKSGPGDQYYATSRLTAGNRVTIYRVTKSGWCAIRPPEGSFSYVRADHVRSTGIPRLLQVIAEDSRTRVGSQLNQSAGVEYVRLKPGETLLSLGSPVTFEGSGVRWYKISPPSGEFRWIHAKNVRAIAAASTATNEAPPSESEVADHDGNLSSSVSTNSTDSAPLSLDEAVGSAVANSPADSVNDRSQSNVTPDTNDDEIDLRESLTAARKLLGAIADSSQTEKPSSSSTLERTSIAPTDAEHFATRHNTEGSTVANTDDDSAELATAAIPSQQMVTEPIPMAMNSHQASHSLSNLTRSAANSEAIALTSHGTELEEPATIAMQASDSPRSNSTELVRLELALSRTVTQDIGAWQLTGLQEQIALIARQSADPSTRQHATQLLARVNEFAELQQRHQLMLSAEQQVPIPTISLASAIEPAPRIEYNVQPVQATIPTAPWPTKTSPEDETTNFVGQGWLVPVFTSRSDIPRFAVTDDEGNVLQFIIPSAGLNLRRYLRQEVGIIGHPAARPVDGSQPAIVAERVVVLDRHR